MSTFPPPRGPPPRPAPTPSAPTSTLTMHNFRITTTKLPICNSTEIDIMTKSLGISPPEMIFGNNEVRVEYLGPPVAPEGGGVVNGVDSSREILWGIRFTAHDALDLVDKTGAKGMLKVAYSDSWQKQRENVSVHGEKIREYVRPFDWSYTTSYKGTILPQTTTQTSTSTSSTTTPPTTNTLIQISKYEFTQEPGTATLPTALLILPDPILLFDSLVLYEDELADNGISLYTVKLRVMPHRMLILARFFLRLDEVLFRLRDTRVYIDFAVPGAKGEGEKGGRPTVWREYSEKEGEWDKVLEGVRREGLGGGDIAGALRDPEKVGRWLGMGGGGRRMEKVVLG